MTASAIPLLVAFAATLCCATAALAQEPRREAAPHVHGEGRLAIAIEGKRVAIELEAPAKDIVGFEHAAKTDAQRKAVTAARKKLSDGGKMLGLTPAAACKQSEAKVDLSEVSAKAKGHSHNHGHKHSHDKHDHGKADAKHDDHDHAEVRVTYSFDCKSPDLVKSLALGYFDAFKGAERLLVTVIGPKGQASADASRASPSVDLSAAN